MDLLSCLDDVEYLWRSTIPRPRCPTVVVPTMSACLSRDSADSTAWLTDHFLPVLSSIPAPGMHSSYSCGGSVANIAIYIRVNILLLFCWVTLTLMLYCSCVSRLIFRPKIYYNCIALLFPALVSRLLLHCSYSYNRRNSTYKL